MATCVEMAFPIFVSEVVQRCSKGVSKPFFLVGGGCSVGTSEKNGMIVCCTLYTDMLMTVGWVWDDWRTIYRFFFFRGPRSSKNPVVVVFDWNC